MTYAEKLKDPRWQKKRLQVFERDDWKCQVCHSKKATLHCHHLKYTKHKAPWEYPLKNFIALCYKCHKFISSTLNPGFSFEVNEDAKLRKYILSAFQENIKARGLSKGAEKIYLDYCDGKYKSSIIILFKRI